MSVCDDPRSAVRRRMHKQSLSQNAGAVVMEHVQALRQPRFDNTVEHIAFRLQIIEKRKTRFSNSVIHDGECHVPVHYHEARRLASSSLVRSIARSITCHKPSYIRQAISWGVCTFIEKTDLSSTYSVILFCIYFSLIDLVLGL